LGLSVPVMALDEAKTLGWEQDLTVPVSKWELFTVTGAAAPYTYTKVKDIPFTTQQTTYTTPYTFSHPDNQLSTIRLTIRTVGTNGAVSVYATELVRTRDYRIPAVPSGFREMTTP